MKSDMFFKDYFENSTMGLWWLGQMGLLLKAGNTSLCIDYYASMNLPRRVSPPVPADELRDIDIFIGTHDHLDHIDHDAWKIWAKSNPDAKFIIPKMHMESVLADGVTPENLIGLNDGDSVTIGDFTIHAIAAAHEFFDRDEKTGLYPYLQFVLEANGIRVHHAGDTVRYEGMLSKVKAFGEIDVELLPINGRDGKRYRNNCIGNMTFQEAADFAGEVGTKLILPGHYDMFADNCADPNEFKDYIEAKYHDRLECRIPKILEKIIYKKDIWKKSV